MSTPPTNALDAAAPQQTNPRGIPLFPFMSSVSEYISSPSDVAPTLDRFQEMINKYQFMQTNVESRIAGLREKIPEIRGDLEAVRFLGRKRAALLRSNGTLGGSATVNGKGENGDGVAGEDKDEVDDEDGLDDDDDDLGDDDASRRSTKGKRIQTHLPTTFQLNPTLHAYASIPLIQRSESQSQSTSSTTTTTTQTSPSDPSLDSDEDQFKVHLWLGANTLASYTLREADLLLSSKLETAERTLATSEEDVGFLREQITGLEVATARVWNWDVGEKRRRRMEEEAKGGRKGVEGGKGEEEEEGEGEDD